MFIEQSKQHKFVKIFDKYKLDTKDKIVIIIEQQ